MTDDRPRPRSDSPPPGGDGDPTHEPHPGTDSGPVPPVAGTATTRDGPSDGGEPTGGDRDAETDARTDGDGDADADADQGPSLAYRAARFLRALLAAAVSLATLARALGVL
jgi:hypothetical protein